MFNTYILGQITIMKQSRWIIFGCSIILTFIKFFVEVSYGVFLVELYNTFPGASMALLQWNGSLVSAIETFFIWQALYFIRIFSSQVAMLIGVTIGTTGLVLTSLAQNEYQLLISYGLLYGYGGIFLIKIGLFLVAERFPPDDNFHVFATGFHTVIYPVAVAATPLTGVLINWTSWRISYLIYAAVTLCSGLIVSFIFSYSEHSRKCIDIHQPAIQSFDKPTRQKIYAGFVFYGLSYVSCAMFLNIPVYILKKQTQVLGINEKDGSLCLVLFGVSEGISRLMTTVTGDRFMKNRLMYVFTVLCFLGAVVNLLMGYTAKTSQQLFLYCILIGLLTGPLNATAYPLCGEVFGSYYRNELYSVSGSCFAVGLMFGLFINGLIFDLNGSFTGSFILSGIMQIITGLFTVCVIVMSKKLSHTLLMYKMGLTTS